MNNFAVLTIGYSHNPTSILIGITTNNPCHLTCYYSDKEPGRHKTSRTDRGVTLPWGAYFCFVAWKSVEQTQPGDTLIHIFEIPDWSYCQTKWFTFRGTVAGELSPSVSCIFKHHHSGVPPALYEHYLVGDDTGHLLTPTDWYAQTFTPEVAHRSTSVKLKLYRVGHPGTITVSIRRTIDGLPSGPDLCLGTTWGNTLTTDTNGEWREIELPGGPDLSAFIRHAIVARGLEVTPLNFPVWRGDQSDPTYPGGALCLSGDSGETWREILTTDNMFEEWGIAI